MAACRTRSGARARRLDVSTHRDASKCMPPPKGKRGAYLYPSSSSRGPQEASFPPLNSISKRCEFCCEINRRPCQHIYLTPYKRSQSYYALQSNCEDVVHTGSSYARVTRHGHFAVHLTLSVKSMTCHVRSTGGLTST